MTELWTPHGRLGVDESAAARAIEEYDPDLTLAQDMRSRDFVVALKHHGPDGQPFPVFNLGPRLPSPDEIKRKLYESDVRRHGGKIAQALERRNREKERELARRGEDATTAAAEAYEWAFRKLGDHPSPRIFVPS